MNITKLTTDIAKLLEDMRGGYEEFDLSELDEFFENIDKKMQKNQKK